MNANICSQAHTVYKKKAYELLLGIFKEHKPLWDQMQHNLLATNTIQPCQNLPPLQLVLAAVAFSKKTLYKPISKFYGTSI